MFAPTGESKYVNPMQDDEIEPATPSTVSTQHELHVKLEMRLQAEMT